MLERILDLFRRDYADPGTLLIDEQFTALDTAWEALASLPPPTLIEAELGKSLDRLGELRAQEGILDAQIAALQTELSHVRKVIGAEQLKATDLADSGKPANVTPLRKGKAKEAAE